MKKIIILTALVLCCVMFAACSAGDEADMEIDAHALGQSLADADIYDDLLYEVDDFVVFQIYNLSDYSSSGFAWAGTGATSESVAVFECADAASASGAVAALKDYRNSMLADFARYTAGEIEKLNDAIIESHGKYAIYCVSADASAAAKIIDDFFKNAE